MSRQRIPAKSDNQAIFAENEPITKYSARVLRRQILADGHVDEKERQFLKNLLESGNLMDEGAFHIILNLLLTGKRMA
jgi:hypothetical protein